MSIAFMRLVNTSNVTISPPFPLAVNYTVVPKNAKTKTIIQNITVVTPQLYCG